MQCGGAAGVNPSDGDILFLGLLGCADDHFVGNRVGEQNQKVRVAQIFAQHSLLFGIDLGLAAEFFTDILILTHHAFVAADDDDTHENLLIMFEQN